MHYQKEKVMKWIKYELKTTTEATDLVIDMLSDLGIDGVEVVDRVPLTESEKEKMFVDILPESLPDDGRATLYFYVSDGNNTNSSFNNTGTEIKENSTINTDELFEKIGKGLEDISNFIDIGEGTITISETEDVDWTTKWKDYFHSFKIGSKILVTPTWEETKSEGDNIIIKIDPGIAFGTGSHETTKLCIEELIKYVKTGSEILDVGCGSAILTIAAIKLGANNGYAIDIDSMAVEQAKENVKINNVENAITLKVGNLLEDKKLCKEIYQNQYDIVVANILAPVLISLTPVIFPALKEGGYYICSGIVKECKNDVIKAIQNAGLNLISEKCENDWVCLVARR